jgi:hypothetical protein
LQPGQAGQAAKGTLGTCSNLKSNSVMRRNCFSNSQVYAGHLQQQQQQRPASCTCFAEMCVLSWWKHVCRIACSSSSHDTAMKRAALTTGVFLQLSNTKNSYRWQLSDSNRGCKTALVVF